jgi:hypothetical protein
MQALALDGDRTKKSKSCIPGKVGIQAITSCTAAGAVLQPLEAYLDHWHEIRANRRATAEFSHRGKERGKEKVWPSREQVP